VEVLEWMKGRGHKKGMEMVSSLGADQGHLEVVKWGWEERGWDEEGEDEIIGEALCGGDMETIEWVYDQVGKLQPLFYSHILNSRDPEYILSICNFLENKGCMIEHDYSLWSKALWIGNSEIFEWLAERLPVTFKVWELAVTHDCFDSLQWLKSKGMPPPPFKGEGEGEGGGREDQEDERGQEGDLFLYVQSVKTAEWLKEAGFVPQTRLAIHLGFRSAEVVEWLRKEGYQFL
jgi:hypothetical protein